MRALFLLFAGIAGAVLTSLVLGDYTISLPAIVDVLMGGKADPAAKFVLLDVRMPRAMLALLVGCALAVAGVIAQSVMRNPLAEPGILGINGGAAFAVTLFMIGMNDAPLHLLPWLAFGGALVTALAVYALSWRGGLSSSRIILIGIGVSALTGAAVSFLSAFGDIQAVQRAMLWLSGTVYDSRWIKVQALGLWLVPALAVAILFSRELDLLALDEETARGLGQPVDRIRTVMLFLCSALTGAAVAAAGLVAFIGLIAPHIARRMAGPDHIRLIPVSALVGALLVIVADLAGRTIIAPAQLPVGLMAALIGAPFFGYLMWKRRYG